MSKFPAEETFKLLLEEFKTVHVPVAAVSKKYLSLSDRVAAQKANSGQLPFPTFQANSRKSPILVDLRDVALWLDRVRNEQQDDWSQLQS